MTDAELAKLIADNLPKPYALDDVWKQLHGGGSEFDLSCADADSVEQWLQLAHKVRAAFEAK